MKNSSATLFLFCLLVGSLSSWAQTNQTTTGKVGAIQIDSSGVVFVTLEGAPFLCATATTRFFARLHTDMPGRTAEAVRNQLSILTAAKLSGRSVSIVASDATSVGPNSGGFCNLLVVSLP